MLLFFSEISLAASGTLEHGSAINISTAVSSSTPWLGRDYFRTRTKCTIGKSETVKKIVYFIDMTTDCGFISWFESSGEEKAGE